MESRGARHTLILRRVEKEDFANYSCYATNKLGKDRAYLMLRGKIAARNKLRRQFIKPIDFFQAIPIPPCSTARC